MTLLELLVTLALSSLVVTLVYGFYKDFGKVARLTGDRREMGIQAVAVLNSLTENLLAGKGVLSVGDNHVVLLNAASVQVEYAWADSILSINSKKYDLPISELHIEPIGPTRPRSPNGFVDENIPWAFDSLDVDRDGSIDFRELDLNNNGELDFEESRRIALFKVTLNTVDHNVPMSMTAVVHPRNHLIALQNQLKPVNGPNFW